MQGQAEQLSKSRKKFLATTYKPLFPPLYVCTITRPQSTSGCRRSHWSDRMRVRAPVLLLSVSKFESRCLPTGFGICRNQTARRKQATTMTMISNVDAANNDILLFVTLFLPLRPSILSRVVAADGRERDARARYAQFGLSFASLASPRRSALESSNEALK